MTSGLSDKYSYRDIPTHIEVNIAALLEAEKILKESASHQTSKGANVQQPVMDIFVNRANGMYQTAVEAKAIEAADTARETRIVSVKLERRELPEQRDPSAFVEFHVEPEGRIRFLLDERKGREMQSYVNDKLQQPIKTWFGKTTDHLLALSLLLAEIWCYRDCSQAKMCLPPSAASAFLTLIPIAFVAVLLFRPLHRIWSTMVPSVFLIGGVGESHKERKRKAKLVFTVVNILLAVFSLVTGLATILGK